MKQTFLTLFFGAGEKIVSTKGDVSLEEGPNNESITKGCLLYLVLKHKSEKKLPPAYLILTVLSSAPWTLKGVDFNLHQLQDF